VAADSTVVLVNNPRVPQARDDLLSIGEVARRSGASVGRCETTTASGCRSRRPPTRRRPTGATRATSLRRPARSRPAATAATQRPSRPRCSTGCGSCSRSLTARGLDAPELVNAPHASHDHQTSIGTARHLAIGDPQIARV